MDRENTQKNMQNEKAAYTSETMQKHVQSEKAAYTSETMQKHVQSEKAAYASETMQKHMQSENTAYASETMQKHMRQQYQARAQQNITENGSIAAQPGHTFNSAYQQIPPNSLYPSYTPKQEDPAENQRKAEFFQKMILPTLLYAVLYTFFLYNNLSGITVPFCVLATLGYCYYAFKQFNIAPKKATYFYAGAMLLIGISSATTGNVYMIAMNALALALMLVSMLVHNFCEDTSWGFVKSLLAICETFVYTIEALPAPIVDGLSYQKTNKKKAQSKSLYILIGVVISIPLVIFIIAMLYQADAVFAEVIRTIFDGINIATIMGIIFLFIFAFFCSYCGMRALEKNKISAETKDYRHYEPLVAITVLSIISVVYVFFSMIQIMYLFLGKMTLPEGFTYAQYARQGFFQLLAVCLLNVLIVLFVLGFFRKSKVLNTLLAIMSCCTYIMLASSAYRMILYVQNYGLTFLRILVLWSIALIGVLLAGILLQIFMEKFPLFRYGLVVISVWFIAMSYSHPDYMIAKYNLSSHVNKNEVDYEYLTRLSSDAAPAIAQCDEPWVEQYAFHMANDKNDSIRKYNFSRAEAQRLLREKIAKVDNSVCVILKEPEGINLENVKLKYPTDHNKYAEVETERIPAAGSKQAEYVAYLPVDNMINAGADGGKEQAASAGPADRGKEQAVSAGSADSIEQAASNGIDDGNSRIENGKDVEIIYTFSINGKSYTSDTCDLYTSIGRTYLIGMDTYNYENDVDEAFVIYQDYSY